MHPLPALGAMNPRRIRNRPSLVRSRHELVGGHGAHLWVPLRYNPSIRGTVCAARSATFLPLQQRPRGVRRLLVIWRDPAVLRRSLVAPSRRRLERSIMQLNRAEHPEGHRHEEPLIGSRVHRQRSRHGPENHTQHHRHGDHRRGPVGRLDGFAVGPLPEEFRQLVHVAGGGEGDGLHAGTVRAGESEWQRHEQ
eukprot:scaffold8765_cov131-Isochrysis_galbana.AAC.3